MRIGLLCAIFLMATPCALAQEVVSIPFAPNIPSRYIIDEVRTRTFEQDGSTQTRGGRVRTMFEIRSRDDGFEAVWTTLSAEPAAIVIDNGGADPTLLIGRPIVLTLNESGAAATMEDWRGVRRGMFRIILEHERDPLWRRAYSATERMMEAWSPEVAATRLMETLSILSACHNTALVPRRREGTLVHLPNALGGPPIATRVEWELQEVDGVAGVARILHTRVPDLESANASAALSAEGLVRSEDDEGDVIEAAAQTTTCEVDLQTGLVRSAAFEVRIGIGGESEVRRRTISLTPQ